MPTSARAILHHTDQKGPNILTGSVWGIIYFCTMDGFFRILEKTSSEVLLHCLLVHSVLQNLYLCYFISVTCQCLFIRCLFDDYWILLIFPFWIHIHTKRNLVWSCLFLLFRILQYCISCSKQIDTETLTRKPSLSCDGLR